ncbi:MAG: DUF4230 domain-containing protein [Verrucomicrobia bacterium]|nr:DUF4230 domain-containing protein [Verrucomicrobiota bacterium]
MSKLRLAATAILLLIALALGLFLGAKFFELTSSRSGVRTLNTAVLLQQVQSLAQLVTVKYVLEKIVVAEDVKWYGESRVILVAHGVVKAGVDLQKLRAEDVRTSKGKISVMLPPPVILDVHLDDDRTEIVERSTGLLRQFDKDLEQNARREALGSMRRAAHAQGILKEAENRLRDQMTFLFRQLGFDEVEINFSSTRGR